MLRKFSLIVITLWVGALWMTGLSASILFETIADRQLAGEVAGRLFTTVSYIAFVSGTFLLIQQWFEHKTFVFKQSIFWVVSTMLLLAVIGHFGIQAHLAQLKENAYPTNVMHSEYASQFATWHGVSGAFYLIECLLGIALVLKSNTQTPVSNNI